MDDPALASLSLTHISYDPNDPISYFSAWLSLVPQGLIVSYLTLCWATREVEIILCFAGQLGCEALNFALKRLIREERPNLRHRGKGYGMPSSHAQFMAFFAVYISLFLILRHRSSEASLLRHRKAQPKLAALLFPSPYVQQVLTSLAVLVNAALVAASRVYLSYHTEKQVFVGCAVGASFAVIWFAFTAIVRDIGLVTWLLELELVRAFRIKDLIIDEDLVESGWREFESKREAKTQKLHINRGKDE